MRNFFLFTALLLVSPSTLPYNWSMQKKAVPLKSGTDEVVWPPEHRGGPLLFFKHQGLVQNGALQNAREDAIGINCGPKLPTAPGSSQNSWATFGSSCGPGEAVMWFGLRWKAEGMNKILDEAFTLTDDVYITEYGSDANVHEYGKSDFAYNDEAQARYLKELTERIRDYIVLPPQRHPRKPN